MNLFVSKLHAEYAIGISRSMAAMSLMLSFFSISPARAELIVYEGFDYADGDLRDQSGGEGDWTSLWLQGGGFGSGLTWQVGSPSLGYTDSGGRALVTSGKAVRASTSSEVRDTRSWDTTGRKNDGDVLWFSFLFNRAANQTLSMHF